MSERGPFVQADLLSRVEVAVPAVAPGFVLPGELLDAEMWLAARMREHGVDSVFDGVTDSDVRKARFRQRIVEGGLQMVMACQAEDGRTAETYAEAFERIYGEPLELAAVKRHKRARKATPEAEFSAEDSVSFCSESSGPPGLPAMDTPQRDRVMNPPAPAAQGVEARNPSTSPRKEGREALPIEASAARSVSAAEVPVGKTAEEQAAPSAAIPIDDDSIAF